LVSIKFAFPDDRTNICGRNIYKDDTRYVNFSLDHNSPQLTLKFTSTLD